MILCQTDRHFLSYFRIHDIFGESIFIQKFLPCNRACHTMSHTNKSHLKKFPYASKQKQKAELIRLLEVINLEYRQRNSNGIWYNCRECNVLLRQITEMIITHIFIFISSDLMWN